MGHFIGLGEMLIEMPQYGLSILTPSSSNSSLKRPEVKLLVSMWMMERYEVGESWTPIFHCIAHHNCENQKFWIFGTTWYDIKIYGKFQMVHHVPTLIPLKNIMGGDNVKCLQSC
ncbi:hypothetical protein Ahy_B06g080451 [Arachis hypogaea]|uniref:Uncharacterized protein n=1 Tax=Arachis hypogaea TaxID=3818 RepID=A0A444YI34_ARAHY|nr:hypothetical protein Ahy_B06g080451 [Arachis hypogaea]